LGTEPSWRRPYRAHLERLGVEKIRRVLAAVAHGAGAEGVVLLCFEDLDDEAQWCHRCDKSVTEEGWIRMSGRVNA
jgi:hypothetical protein